ncbi:hypothetical protein BDZ85DRAFT_247093 [Elsinoe ampelina]|uniref:Uncharacterized protein n=1 Tax=Elsinoe ampelina TaxID=302913 RepID=A0A6A6GLT4_9PEZI|nr:hypothetical protein BDZ85DRAFT_247093 [Elsinoe ampelina]
MRSFALIAILLTIITCLANAAPVSLKLDRRGDEKSSKSNPPTNSQASQGSQQSPVGPATPGAANEDTIATFPETLPNSETNPPPKYPGKGMENDGHEVEHPESNSAEALAQNSGEHRDGLPENVQPQPTSSSDEKKPKSSDGQGSPAKPPPPSPPGERPTLAPLTTDFTPVILPVSRNYNADTGLDDILDTPASGGLGPQTVPLPQAAPDQPPSNPPPGSQEKLQPPSPSSEKSTTKQDSTAPSSPVPDSPASDKTVTTNGAQSPHQDTQSPQSPLPPAYKTTENSPISPNMQQHSGIQSLTGVMKDQTPPTPSDPPPYKSGNPISPSQKSPTSPPGQQSDSQSTTPASPTPSSPKTATSSPTTPTKPKPGGKKP